MPKKVNVFSFKSQHDIAMLPRLSAESLRLRDESRHRFASKRLWRLLEMRGQLRPF